MRAPESGKGDSVPVNEDAQTADIGEAEALIGRVYGRGRIHESEMPFRFRQRLRGDEHVTLAQFEVNSYADITAEYQNVVGIGLMSAGTYSATSNGLEVDSDAPFLLRPGEVRSWSNGLDLTIVNLTPAALERAAGYVPGSLRLPSVAPISSAMAASWTGAARYAAGVLANDEMLHNELLLRAVVDALLATAIAAFPTEGRHLDKRPHAVAPRTVRRAVQFIEEHAAEPISTVEIAAAVGISPRGLQAAFQRALGTTPSRMLRDVRLERARSELADADPSLTVAEAARHWGFAHLGRFAASYRARFGEFPSDTRRDG